jgi:Uma2 family endonuclease
MSTATPDAPTNAPAPPDESALDGLYEIVDDQIVEKDTVGAYELVLANTLADLIRSQPGVRDLGRVLVEVVFDLRPAVNRHRRPDVAFVSFERWPRAREVPDAVSWPIVPDLAIEVVSRSNSAPAVKSKMREYFAAGVRRVWIVFPKTREIEDYDAPTSVRIVEAGGALDASALWPGVRIDVAQVFANP